MECGDDMFIKQYGNRESIFNNYIKRDVHIYSRPPTVPSNYNLVQYIPHHQRNFDEPIDLTQNPSSSRFIKTENPRGPLQPNNHHITRQTPCLFKARGKRNKFLNANVLDQNQLQSLFGEVIDYQTTENKQAEILKAAKSLFSKRTRTLYHWMYPNTSKAQIKLAVANSWEHLGAQEKQFYISQVLVRFGFPQSNLMVNPQLGGIKELPPLPETFPQPETYSNSAKELQAAISSISGESSCVSALESGKRKQGRPLGSKNKKKRSFNGGMQSEQLATYRVAKDFQDDPELSKELEKFAISFDWLK